MRRLNEENDEFMQVYEQEARQHKQVGWGATRSRTAPYSVCSQPVNAPGAGRKQSKGNAIG